MYSFLSRLMDASRAVKQSRMHDITAHYMHEQSILIESLLKAYYKNYVMKNQHLLPEQLLITSYCI